MRYLLESAGLSSSNSYHVVSQGRVNEIATMRPERRLEMLKEIGGTSALRAVQLFHFSSLLEENCMTQIVRNCYAAVYESKRQESVNNLHDTEQSRREIEESMSSIESKLSELESEKAELAEYEKLDKKRRALQYCMYRAEYKRALEAIENGQQEYQQCSERQQQLTQEVTTMRNQIPELEQKVSSLDKERERSEKESEEPTSRKQAAMQEKERLKNELEELDSTIESMHNGTAAASGSLQEIEKEIANVEAAISSLNSQLEKKKEGEKVLQEQKQQKERRMKELRTKQGRAAEFASAEERDKWLEKQAQHFDATISYQRNELQQLEQEQSKHEKEKANVESEAQQAESSAQASLDSVLSLENERSNLYGSLQEQQEKKRSLWQRKTQIESEYKEANEEFKKADDELQSSIPRDISRGIRAMDRILREQQMEGVHGKLFDLISCDERFNDAVEVVGNQSLFNVVVEDDDVAGQVISQLNQRKAGRVTMMPLNRVRGDKVSAPESSHDAVPLADHVDSEQRFRNAVEHVFGKSLFCRDLDVATRVANERNVDTVTPEGQQVARKGGLTGGYKDPSRSKLALMKRHKQYDTTRKAKLGELEQVKRELREVEDEYTRLKSDYERKGDERERMNAERTQSKKRAEQNYKRAEQIRQRVADLRDKIESWQHELHKNEEDVRMLRSELSTSLRSDLSNEEQDEMHRLQHELTNLSSELSQVQSERTKLEEKLESERSKLDGRLYKRREEAKRETASDMLEQKRRERQDKSRDLGMKQSELDDLEGRTSELDSKIADLQRRIRDKRREAETAKKELSDKEYELSDIERQQETLGNKLRANKETKDKYAQHIHELGSPPEQAFSELAELEQDRLRNELQRTNKELRRYSQLNKKALFQHSGFVQEKEGLKQRVEDVNKSKDKIEELISVLDEKKNDAIQTTFRQVSQQFEETFKTLVPSGWGELKWQYSSYDQQALENNSPLRYTGVDIKVQFGSDAETMRIEQLSGGQKTVVALAFMFAIQRTDAAPFYLFDEIDAALDHNYRRAVAKLIESQAEESEDNSGSQFIATTFGHDMVDSAEKVFGVAHQDRISSIQEINHEDARRFLQERMQAQLGDAVQAPHIGEAMEEDGEPREAHANGKQNMVQPLANGNAHAGIGDDGADDEMDE